MATCARRKVRRAPASSIRVCLSGEASVHTVVVAGPCFEIERWRWHVACHVSFERSFVERCQPSGREALLFITLSNGAPQDASSIPPRAKPVCQSSFEIHKFTRRTPIDAVELFNVRAWCDQPCSQSSKRQGIAFETAGNLAIFRTTGSSILHHDLV